MAVRNWKFGTRPPTEGADRVAELLELSSRYYEQLTKIERGRQRRYQAIRRKYVPELGDLEEAYAAANRKVGDIYREAKRGRKAHWVATGGKKTLEQTLDLPVDLKDQVDALKAEMSQLSEESRPLRDAFEASLAEPRKQYELRTTGIPESLLDSIEEQRQRIKQSKRAKVPKNEIDALKAELKEMLERKKALTPPPTIKSKRNAEVLDEMLAEDWPAAWKDLAESEAQANRQLKAARSKCGLPPGTYMQTEEAFSRATQDSFPNPPRYFSHREHFRGTGKIAVQLPGRTTFGDIITGNSAKLRLTPSVRHGARGKQSHYWVAHIQIARNMRKGSEWASFPVKLDRRPPDDALVKWAWVTVRKRGERIVYEFQMTLSHGDFDKPKRPAGTGHGGHVRIGWAATDSGVRVARLDSGEVVLPLSILEQGEHSAVLRGHADEHFYTAKRTLKLWVSRGPNRLLYWDRIVGAHQRITFRNLCTEFAIARFGEPLLRRLWTQWRNYRLGAGRDLFAYLRTADRWIRQQGYAAQEDRLAFWLYLWARKDAHLRQYSADSLGRFEARRHEFYRLEAIRIATQFETVTVDKYSIAELKKLPEIKMPNDRVNERAQHNLQLAAPGQFREILREVMGDRCKPSERSGADETPGTARNAKTKKKSAKKSRKIATEAAD